jgi:hypothetical protein
MAPFRMHRNAENGFALLVVLWTMVLLALLASQVTGAGRAETKVAAALRISAQLQQAADGAVFETIWHMLDGNGDAWVPGAGSQVLQEPGARVLIDIEDERGKIDLNNAPQGLVQALFNVVGADSVTAATMPRQSTIGGNRADRTMRIARRLRHIAWRGAPGDRPARIWSGWTSCC